MRGFGNLCLLLNDLNRQMAIFMFRSVFVYIIPAALNERFPELSKFVVLPNFFSEKVSSTDILRHYSCSSTADAKVLFTVCLWTKILLSIANSTSKCSAQNLGSKLTNRQFQRSRFPIFSNMYCLDASTLLVVYENTLLSFVLN